MPRYTARSKRFRFSLGAQIIILALIIGIIFPAILTSCLRRSNAEAVSQWTSTTSYPTDIGGQSCVRYSGYIYCVGGDNGSTVTNAVYYAPISSSGIGTWSSTVSYPSNIEAQSCAAYSGYIYCVGGDNSSGWSSATVYYAPVSSSGVGTWMSTTNYPFGDEDQSCTVYSGYIYCVGGSESGYYVNAVYYAPISSSGVGTWTSTTSYPRPDIVFQSCAAYSGYIYCVQGYSTDFIGIGVYYAPISSSGVGNWTSTTSYPFGDADQSCAVYSGYIYCIGGDSPSPINAVYYAPISSSGVGNWTSTTSYPPSIAYQSCTIYSGYVYCVGGNTGSGYTNADYYGEIEVFTTTTQTNTTTVTSTTPIIHTSTTTVTSANTTTKTSTTTVIVVSAGALTDFAIVAVIGILIGAGATLFIRRR